MNGWPWLRTMRKSSNDEIKSRRPGLAELEGLPRCPVTVIADNIRSLYNVGSIFRSCDAVGVEALYLCGITPHPPRPEISKTALGAENSVPWEYHEDILSVLEYFKKAQIPIVALEHTSGSVDFQDFAYPFPMVVILGNEAEGVSDAVMPYVDFAVEIPMAGIKQSLNVSVACGVMLYEVQRQFRAWAGPQL